MADNTSSWMEFAQRPYDEGGLGLAKHQAAGIVGNLQNESGQGITPWGVSGDNGTAQGSAQWRLDRLDALKSMYPDTYQTPEAQQAFMRHELSTTHNSAYKALQAAQSPEEAARAFNSKYEISADTTGHRAASARMAFGSDVLPDAGGPSSYISPALAAIQKATRTVPALSPDNTMGTGALSAYGPNALNDPSQQGQAPQDPWDRRAEGLSQIGAALAGIVNPQQAYAINQSILANRKVQTPKDAGTWSSHVMPNGQVMQTHSLTGQTRVLPGNYAAPSDKAAEADPMAPQMIPVWGDAKALGDGTKPATPEQEAAFYASMEPSKAALVKGLVDGTAPAPTAAAMTRKDSPYPAAFAAAKRIDDSVDATSYAGRVSGQQDWKKKGAESARALNQTISHQSGVLIDAMKKLDNGQHPLLNSAGNVYSEVWGGSDKVPVFRTAAHAVVDELGKVFKQNNLSDTEIRKWEENLPANMSPEQQRGQIGAFGKLMHGAMDALEGKRIEQIGKRNATRAGSLLTDEGKAGLQMLQDFAAPPVAAPAKPPAASPAKRVPLGDIFN